MYLVASMGPPGGGRMVISRRLQSRFNLINMTFPQVSIRLLSWWVYVYPVRKQESQIKRIFGTMINQKLQDFEEDVKPLGDIMTQVRTCSTIHHYSCVIIHYNRPLLISTTSSVLACCPHRLKYTIFST